MPSIKKTTDFLYALERHGIRPGLTRIKRLLKGLGDPQLAYPAVHIAGTNGKGSTSAFLFSVLNEAGLNAGLYTSPHLLRFNERIRTSSGLIKNSEIIKLAGEVKKAARGIKGLTFFEFTTAMAFLHFARKKADIAVVEVGMGGRLDATNVISPLVTVITNVGVDHTEYLGDSIEKIAFEKAGIIKKNTPVVTAEGKPVALKVIKKAARARSSKVFRFGADLSVSSRNGKISYSGLSSSINGLGLSLTGAHQYKNAGCALAAIELLREKGMRIPQGAVKRGLRKADWPGRLEVVMRRPLVVLDSAHNPEGARSLREALKNLRFKRLTLVLGIMKDKDVEGILKELTPLSHTVIATMPSTERSADALSIAALLAKDGREVLVKKRVNDAVNAAIKASKPDDAVCVTGSIFTVAEAKRFFLRKG